MPEVYVEYVLGVSQIGNKEGEGKKEIWVVSALESGPSL